MESKTRYTMVNRTGHEVYHADSFLGFIGMMFLNGILSALGITILAAIVCGIASLFN